MTLRKIDIWTAGIVPLTVVIMAGCAGISMNRLTGMQFHETRTVRGEKAAVFAACRQALEAMHFVYQRGTPGSERLEMEGGMQPGGTAETLRQRHVRVSVESVGELNNEVSIGFWEYSEDVSMGGTVTASGKLLRGGVLYEAFWSTLDAFKPEVSEEEAGAVPEATGP